MAKRSLTRSLAQSTGRVAWLSAAALGLLWASVRALSGAGAKGRTGRGAKLRGSVVVVTGGSRGLGLLLARRFAAEGCKVAIFARDEEELQRAEEDLKARGADVLAVRCDVTQRGEVERAVAVAEERFGRVDVLVNNAGIISVSPLSSTTESDFDRSMGVMFWGPYYATMAVLPGMKRRGEGRIVNITSVGGKLSVPHLVPYSCAKFALVGLSEGLRAELLEQGIVVTTIVPGLMRTGSHLNAEFKSDKQAEVTWFSLSATLPLLSMDAERAAAQIVRATTRGEAERVLSIPAKLAVLLHGVFPGLTADLLGLANRFLLPAAGLDDTLSPGRYVAPRQSPLFRAATRLGERAARRFNQHPGPRAV